MLAHTMGCAARGLDGVLVTVEADVANGLPNFTIVGLTDRAIQESRERVRAAIRNSGYEFPARRLTVNLAPAEIHKEGTGFDLAIAMAILGGRDELRPGDATAFIGELALDGSVRPVAGVLPMTRCLRGAGIRHVVVPEGNAAEAALVAEITVTGVPTLRACVDHVLGNRWLAATPPSSLRPVAVEAGVDFMRIRGLGAAKRALEVTAAGGHNLLMLGSPGAGKTMLARSLVTLLPDLSVTDALDVAAVYSLRGSLGERSPVDSRPPFRAPHHSVSRAGLVGGGMNIAGPGEISLAHCGVLFLDEVCEFPQGHLEALRQPLGEGTITLVRARGSVAFPAAFSLVAAANPCPCGYAGDPSATCRCQPRAIAAYTARLSGPIRDRIDLIVDVPRQPYETLFGELTHESSALVRRRVELARDHRNERERGVRPASPASDPSGMAAFRPSAAAAALLAKAGNQLRLSARGFFRLLKVARTIADLELAGEISADAIAEALQYRAESRRWTA